MSQNKQKGGAEKKRAKNQKLLQESSQSCKKIDQLFKSSRSDVAGKLGDPCDQIVTPQQQEHVSHKHHVNESPNPRENLSTVNVGERKDSSERAPFRRECDRSEQNVNKPENPRENLSLTSAELDAERMNLFKRPKEADLSIFLKCHPIQTSKDPVIRKAFERSDRTKRLWLTYDQDSKQLYCWACLAFSTSTDDSLFISGFKDRKHIHTRVEQHEKSKNHGDCVDAYILRQENSNVKQLLFSNLNSLRNREIAKNRDILVRIVDVMKLIGKRGISYRGSKHEAAYTLDRKELDHGNFLEILLLLGQYDSVLQNHINECIAKSKAIKASKSNSGRGNFTSMISKNTLNSVIACMKKLIKLDIVSEVNEAMIFSIEIDTTLDVTSQDQLSLILRYVFSQEVRERLLSVLKYTDGTGKGMKDLVKSDLDSVGLSIEEKCTGTSCDGASSMQGAYKGFTAWLSRESSHHVHVWCHNHVLNLIMVATTSSTISSQSLFGVLNKIAVFLKESYLRSDAWVLMLDPHDHRRLGLVGDTRWWAKDAALTKIFGSIEKKEKSLFVTVIAVLENIENDTRTKPDARTSAKSFRESLLKKETVFTAFIFLAIFDVTTHPSNYLQTKGLDILTAHNMVQNTLEKLKLVRKKFEWIRSKADEFIDWANMQMEEKDLESIIEIDLPRKRIPKKKLLPGEVANHTVISNPVDEFRIDTFCAIMDTVIPTLESRFEPSKSQFFADLTLLDPRHFSELRSRGIEVPVFECLCEKLSSFDPNIDAESMRNEMRNLVANWDVIRASPLEEYETYPIDDDIQILFDDDSSEFDEKKSKHESCKNCPICCFRLLSQYNLLTGAFPSLGFAYRYTLTLSFTQVACERSFSILKRLKNRLRNSMSNDHLEAFMLMSSEKDLLIKIRCEDIIDLLSKSSKTFRSMFFP